MRKGDAGNFEEHEPPLSPRHLFLPHRLAETRIRNPDTRRERGSEADGGEGYDFDLKKVDVKRVKCDIKDVDVSKLSCGSGLVVAKHLCGMGTDIALRSLRRTKSGGFVMATCCHGVCDWDALVGRDWLVKRFEERGVKLGKGEVRQCLAKANEVERDELQIEHAGWKERPYECIGSRLLLD